MNSNARHDGRAPEMLSGDLDSAACSTPAAPHATHRNGHQAITLAEPILPKRNEAAERRRIERERLRRKRLDPVYLAKEREANRRRMRERRGRARRRHATAEARP